MLIHFSSRSYYVRSWVHVCNLHTTRFMLSAMSYATLLFHCFDLLNRINLINDLVNQFLFTQKVNETVQQRDSASTTHLSLSVWTAVWCCDRETRFSCDWRLLDSCTTTGVDCWKASSLRSYVSEMATDKDPVETYQCRCCKRKQYAWLAAVLV